MSEFVVPIETLKFRQIYSQRFLNCYSKHVHYWRPRWAGWFQDDPGLILALGLFYVCWIFSRSSGSLPQSKNMNIRSTGGYNCPQNVCVKSVYVPLMEWWSKGVFLPLAQ